MEQPKSKLKTPSAVLPFGVTWAAWLAAGETITDSTWTVPAGITEETAPASAVTDGVATIWLSGGTLGEKYRVTNHIVTSQGREDERSIIIEVVIRYGE